MTKEFFEANVIMAVEVEYEDGGRIWKTMSGSEVRSFCENIKNCGISDIDYCTDQRDPEVQKVIDAATKIWSDKGPRDHFKSFDAVIDFLLNNEKQETAKKVKVWTEEEIKNLIQTNDKVLYGALKKLYACQTADEQRAETTKERNGKGFNGVDAPFLSSVAEFLLKRGYLTDKQKACTRKRLVKYNKQLTELANA